MIIAHYFTTLAATNDTAGGGISHKDSYIITVKQ